MFVIPNFPTLLLRRIKRDFLRLRPQKTLDLKFAGRRLPNSVTLLGRYSPPTILESQGVFEDRPVSHAFQSRGFYSVVDATIDSNMGEIYLDSDEFLIQSTPWHPYVPNPERRPPFIKPRRLSQPGGYIRLPTWTYYHQVVEYLAPYLFLRRKFPRAITLVPEEGSSLARAILEDLEIEYETFRNAVTVNKLYFVENGNDSGYPHPRDIEILKSDIIPLALNKHGGSSGHGDESVVYVSRLSSERSPVNELALIEGLRNLKSVRVIESETLSFLEQVSRFRTARHIIGVHGAGLTNQIWMDPGGNVLELVDLNYSNPVFSSLAKLCSHSHSPIFMTQTVKGPEIDLGQAFELIAALD